ncbi:MAG: hypothetical protein ABSF71_11585 [Terriglobia bacterium]|jgi:hypothetical protein
MDIHDLFQSPGSRIAAFAEMQLHLYRHDVRLQDYFEPLQLDTLTTARARSGDRRAFNRPLTWAVRAADKIGRRRSRRKIKTDVLFCPNQDLRRQTEQRFFSRTLLGLAGTGAKVLCLLPADASGREEADAQLAAAGRSGQVEFVDPASHLNAMDERLHSMVARIRGQAAFEETVRVLEPHGLNPGQEVRAGFERIAFYVEAWERLEPWVEFDAVVARCHWLPLCSPVCRTARQRGKPVITFQQGVIGHTLDVPVTASKYVAFGQPSASFLARMNSRFFQAAELRQPPVEYVEGGCLVDKVIPLPDQFAHQTLLLVDVPPAPGDFYGIESQGQALMELAERLLTAELPLRRVVIRPHPFWSNLDLESCKRLVRQHPDRCELSHPSWSLEDDLRRSSIVAGILSGVLTVAAACGLPAIFLETEHGYTTGDLACFSPRQTLLPDAAFCEIRKILTDRQAYAEAQTEALKNAREYYADSTDVKLDGTFFERLLRDKPVSSTPRA